MKEDALRYFYGEAFAPIPSTGDRYSMSRNGICCDLDGDVVPEHINVSSRYSYLCVHNAQGRSISMFVHRAVLEAWIGGDIRTVHHKDGNKQNNHFDNLEYATQSEQKFAAWKDGFYPRHNVLTQEKARKIRDLHSAGMSRGDLTLMFRISRTHLNKILANVRWKEDARVAV